MCGMLSLYSVFHLHRTSTLRVNGWGHTQSLLFYVLFGRNQHIAVVPCGKSRTGGTVASGGTFLKPRQVFFFTCGFRASHQMLGLSSNNAYQPAYMVCGRSNPACNICHAPRILPHTFGAEGAGPAGKLLLMGAAGRQKIAFSRFFLGL